MRTVSILISIKKRLQHIGVDEGCNMDDVVNLLMDSTEPVGLIQMDRERNTIHLKDNTVERLDTFKLYPTEPYTSTLWRLLEEYHCKKSE